MPPLKPKSAFAQSRTPFKVTIIPPGKKRPTSFFEEYYYLVLGIECFLISLFVGAVGMGFWRGLLVGLLMTALTAVAWQFRQYARYKDDPSAKLRLRTPEPGIKPIRPAKRAPVPLGPDGKKIFPPSYFPPLRDKKPKP